MNKFTNLIVGIDFSPRSLSAAQMATSLAESTEATVDLVHVVETEFSDSDAFILKRSKNELLDMLAKEAEAALTGFASQLSYQYLRKTLITGNPAMELTKLSRERNADLLIVGDLGVDSMLPKGVGVTTYRIVEQGPRNVLVVKAGYKRKVRSVAAAVTFVPVADDVLRMAHRVAQLFDARLHVVRVIPDIAELRHRMAFHQFDTERIMSESIIYNEKRLTEFVENYTIDDVALKTDVLLGKPGTALVEYLQNENIDIVVMGTGTSYRIAGYPIGSTTHSVLNRTMSSVCIVRSLEPAP